LIKAIHKFLPKRVEVEGTASGLHIVVWLEDFRIEDEPNLIARAKAISIGIWCITPLYSAGDKFRRKKCAGLFMGSSGLTPTEIKKRVARLAQAIQQN
jgi:GntR family transcriptional regulator/MocR family aminotransferase